MLFKGLYLKRPFLLLSFLLYQGLKPSQSLREEKNQQQQTKTKPNVLDFGSRPPCVW